MTFAESMELVEFIEGTIASAPVEVTAQWKAMIRSRQPNRRRTRRSG